MAKEGSFTGSIHELDTAQRGLVAGAEDQVALAKAIELAVDYRGDVMITRISDEQSIEGYVFDRTDAGDGGDASIRLIPRDSHAKVSIPCRDIRSLSFTGRDTAAGKSFETWIRKYVEKKRAGEEASIYGDMGDMRDMDGSGAKEM